MTPRTLLLAIGLPLIVLTHTVLFAGVAYNRSGEPESRLVLSERELQIAHQRFTPGRRMQVLRLQWRVAQSRDNSSAPYSSPRWLDEKRLAELGFTEALRRAQNTHSKKDYLPASRQVYVMLEFAGPAWQQALEHARQHLAERTALRHQAGTADNIDALDKAQKMLASEQNDRSRLFAIDAGTDPTRLRARYPDRGRYMMIKGVVRLNDREPQQGTPVSARIERLYVETLHIPSALRARFNDSRTYSVTLALGQKYEPILEAVDPR